MKKIQIGFNDLKSQFPQIVAEWHPDKNGDFTPDQVTYGSSKKVWWLCPKGHSYYSSISNRTYLNRGCPYCNHKIVIPGENDLLSQYPLIAKEWDYNSNDILPSEVFAHSGKKYNWICSFCGNKWTATIANRTKGKGCPHCSKAGTSFPEQAIYFYVSQSYSDAINRYLLYDCEFDIYIPSLKVAIEYDGKYFHASEKALSRDNYKDSICLDNGIKLIRIRDPFLSDTNNALRITCIDGNQQDFERALETLKESLNADYLIDLDRNYNEIVSAGRKRIKSNNITETHPRIANEWMHEKNYPIKIEFITHGMDILAWWKCSKCSHEYKQRVYSRTSGQGCKKCGKQKSGINHTHTSAKKNNLLKRYPEISKEWHPVLNKELKPEMFSAGSSKLVWWKCSRCQADFLASISSRTSRNSGCKVCAKERVRTASSRRVKNLDTGETFNSALDACKYYGISHKNFSTAIKNGTTYGGFHWSYVDGMGVKEKTIKRVKNIDTGEIFENIQKAADAYSCSRSTISKACNGKVKTACGFRWETLDN